MSDIPRLLEGIEPGDAKVGERWQPRFYDELLQIAAENVGECRGALKVIKAGRDIQAVIAG